MTPRWGHGDLLHRKHKPGEVKKRTCYVLRNIANMHSLRNKQQKNFWKLETHSSYCRTLGIWGFALHGSMDGSNWLILHEEPKLQHHKIQKHNQRSFRNICPKHLIGGGSASLYYLSFSSWGCRIVTSPEMVEPHATWGIFSTLLKVSPNQVDS